MEGSSEDTWPWVWVWWVHSWDHGIKWLGEFLIKAMLGWAYSDRCQVTTFPFNSPLKRGLGWATCYLSNIPTGHGYGSPFSSINRSWDKHPTPPQVLKLASFKTHYTWALSNPDVRQDKERWHVDGPLRSEKRRVMEESSDDCFSDSRYNETRELGALWAFQGTSHNKQINNRKNISAKTNDINIIFYCPAIDFVTAWVTSEHTINWQQEMDEKQSSTLM